MALIGWLDDVTDLELIEGLWPDVPLDTDSDDVRVVAGVVALPLTDVLLDCLPSDPPGPGDHPQTVPAGRT